MTRAQSPTLLVDANEVRDGLASRLLQQTSAFAILRSASSLSTWLAFVALSHILSKRDFGVFEIGVFYIGLGSLLGDGGLAASLVRRRGDVQPIEFSVVFTGALALSLLLAAGFLLALPRIAAANQLSEQERWALCCMSLTSLLPAFRSVPYVRLERRIDFASIGRIELIANLCRHVTALGVALWIGGAWALVLSQLVQALSQVVLAYRAAPGWVGFGWRRSVFRELFAYGSRVQAGNFALYLKDNLAGALGPWLGPSTVGVLRFGLQFVRVPADAVNGVARVQFPVFARLDRADPALFDLLAKSLRAALLLGLPLLALLAIGSTWFVPAIYGAKWSAAFPVIWALVPYVVADLLALQLFTFFQGQGRAGFALAMYVTWAALLWLFAACALAWFDGSLFALGIAYSAATVITVVVLLARATAHLQRALVRALVGPLTGATLGFAAAFGARMQLPADHLPLRAALEFALFSAVFLFSVYAIDGRAALAEARSAYLTLRGRRP